MTAAPASVNYAVFALSELAGDDYTVLREAVEERLQAFECERSPHLEEFARVSVRKYEEHGHSRTYVLVCPDGEDAIDVPAFFTVGMTSLDLTAVSSNLRKKLNGNISMEHTGAYTIAELARSDRYTSEQLPGSVILDEAKEIVRQSRELIAGRFLVVDAQEAVFDALYGPAGFKRIGTAKSPQSMQDKAFITACAKISDW